MGYKKCRAIAQRTIKFTKKQYWRDFCTSFNDKQNKTVWRTVWRTINGIKNSNRPPKIANLTVGNETVVSDADKADIFVSQFAKASSNINLVSDFLQSRPEADKLIDNLIDTIGNVTSINNSIHVNDSISP